MNTTMPVLAMKDFGVTFETPEGRVHAVKYVSMVIKKGECLGVVGESGAGKSQTFLGAFGLLPENGRAAGVIRFQGRDLLGLARRDLDQIRGREAAFVFQDPLTALSPHLKIGEQLAEVVGRHFGVPRLEARERAEHWLERVRIPDPARRLEQHPHELSGGMRQRVMIAMAMMCEPALLIADEPTAALDATIQAQVLDLIDELRRDLGAAVALITRDMGVIARMAQRVAVMRDGIVVETGDVEHIFAAPKTDYTRTLLAAAPRIDAARTRALRPPAEGPALLSVDDVRVHFPVRVPGGPLWGVFGRVKQLRAVDGVTFSLSEGETLGIVGESGSGKSSLARAIVQLLPRAAGAVTFVGQDLVPSEADAIRRAREDLQIVFQDPLASLDPRMTIGASIAEPLIAFAPLLSREDRALRAREMMAQVGLDGELVNRYPHELSVGQRQRAGVARAMILRPKLVVCDEAVSALDVSIQAQILDLLAELQRRYGTAMLFISHDLAVVRALSHKVLVLYLGRAVEYGPAETVFAAPRHPYTRALIAAALTPDPKAARARPKLRAIEDTPSPLDSRATLRFLKSRLVDDPDAVQYRPHWIEIAPGHFVAEHDEEEKAA